MRWALKPLALLSVITALLMIAAAGASAETVPLPSGAATGSGQNYQLNATACPAAGDCVAVGSYDDGNDDQQGLIETETNGNWSAGAVEGLSGLPTGADSDPSAVLTAVSCTSVGNCVAVGYYTDGSDNGQGLIETETNGAWSASEASLSGLAYSDPDVDLETISCTSAGNCVAAGSYYDNDGDEQGLILTETNGRWSASEANLQGLSTAANPDVDLSTVACASVGYCAAVGYYETDNTSNTTEGLILTETGGTWTTREADLGNLPSVNSSQYARLESVSCPAAGSCTAVGYYTDGNGSYQALLLSEQNGAWQPGTEGTLPANAAANTASQLDLYLNSVSCASAGNCTAVGSYDATAANDVEPLTLTETGGSWGTGLETSLPADANITPSGASNPSASLDSVYCESAGNCIADGTYEDSDGDDATLIAQQAGGSWSTAGAEQSTAYAGYRDNLASTSCAPSGYCAAAGYSEDYTSTSDTGFLLDAPDAGAAPSAPLSGTYAIMSWSAPSDDGGLPVTSYKLTVDNLTDSSATPNAFTASVEMYSVTFGGLTPGDSYTFTVSATSLLGVGISATSAPVAVPAATPTPAPAPPTTAAAPTRAQLLATLQPLLAPTGKKSRVESLRKTHAFTFTYRPLESGTATVNWYEVTGKGKAAKKHLVASGSARTHGTAIAKLEVELSKLGKHLLETHRALELTTVAAFKYDITEVSRTHKFKLRW